MISRTARLDRHGLAARVRPEFLLSVSENIAAQNFYSRLDEALLIAALRTRATMRPAEFYSPEEWDELRRAERIGDAVERERENEVPKLENA